MTGTVYTDFHTHALRPDCISIVSAPTRPPGAEYWSLEIHPWYPLPSGITAAAAEAAAIGESGLDRHRGLPMEEQLQNFKIACALAAENSKALILHEVRAFEDVKNILRRYTIPSILRHGWRTDNINKLEKALAENWYIGCGPATPETIISYFRIHPEHLAHLALESDDSGTDIAEVYRRTAAVLQIPENKLIELMAENFRRFLMI